MSETEDTIALLDHLVLVLILVLILTHFRSSRPEVFYTTGNQKFPQFLQISQNSQENTCASITFLIKFQAPHLRWFFLTLDSFSTNCSHTILNKQLVAMRIQAEKSVLQLCKGAEKKLKAVRESQIDVFVENARLYLPMQGVCAAVRKMKSRMKFLRVTFFISDDII